MQLTLESTPKLLTPKASTVTGSIECTQLSLLCGDRCLLSVLFWGGFFSDAVVTLKAANLQQCMGTAEGSPMRLDGLDGSGSSNREWSEQ